MRLPVFVALGIAATLATSGTARAQGYLLDRFDPSERGSEWFAADSLDLRGKVRVATGFVGAFAYRPLVVQSGGVTTTAIVEQSWVVHTGASVVLLDEVRLGFDLPLYAYQTGTTAVVATDFVEAPAAAQAFGDVRLGVTLRLFGKHGDAVTGAFSGLFYLPTGSPASYTGDGIVRGGGNLAVAGDVGTFTYAAGLGMHVRPELSGPAAEGLGVEVRYSAAAGLRVLDGHLVLGPEIFGAVVVSNAANDLTARSTPLEGVMGAHVTLGRAWTMFRIGGGAGGGLTRGLGTPRVRVLLDLEWTPDVVPPPAPAPVPIDTDSDGVPDDTDACPTIAGAASVDRLKNGCPKAKDADKDGFTDDVDACPTLPGVAQDDPAKQGCPPPEAPADAPPP
ncbi:MAG TPA: thrombospondin type 3 repeat-containing protein [Polyangiaceae bacterium]